MHTQSFDSSRNHDIIISYIDDNVCFDSGIHDYYDCTITNILIIRRIMIVMMIIRIPYFWNDSNTTGKENSTVRMHFVVSCFAHSPLNTLGPPCFFWFRRIYHESIAIVISMLKGT